MHRRSRDRRCMGHDFRFLAADLLRLLRLHRYRARFRRAVRLPYPDQLRRAVPGNVAGGLLAPLAYLPLLVAARLHLHPARRLAAAEGDRDAEPSDYVRARWTLARSGLALRCLGCPVGRGALAAAPV